MFIYRMLTWNSPKKTLNTGTAIKYPPNSNHNKVASTIAVIEDGDRAWQKIDRNGRESEEKMGCCGGGDSRGVSSLGSKTWTDIVTSLEKDGFDSFS
ncbi:hypothetical protein BOTNAR_0090g00210 [Botryotinia narcissicola]|uniref:Uncharacterized protein n=1 Tax=Botryotinia narcissicola TaxID=278944 RepID=A0A4Z1IS13_9HELO|nr:hypothetical protein BOTNAR_0090g00210 [Botryotinia narcissicola]